MSWSVNFIGKPEKVIAALEQSSVDLDGQSKLEYDSAKTHIIGLVKENFGHDYMIKVVASGHGYSVGGEQKDRQCSVLIEPIYSILV